MIEITKQNAVKAYANMAVQCLGEDQNLVQVSQDGKLFAFIFIPDERQDRFVSFMDLLIASVGANTFFMETAQRFMGSQND